MNGVGTCGKSACPGTSFFYCNKRKKLIDTMGKYTYRRCNYE